jgi:uncharacterized protein YdhG (YjbR/CyaY superfamily)
MNKTSPYGSTKFTKIDEYHASFPKNIQKLLQQLRLIITQAAPEATEVISYGMPAFKHHNVLVYYAAHKEHIGFYPTSKPIVVFKKELAKYKTSKGAIQFPLDKPLPVSLIKKIIKFRVNDVLKKVSLKKVKPGIVKKVLLNKDIQAYNNSQSGEDRKICKLLAQEICQGLPDAENKIWHAHPVWFLDANPIVGYDKLKDSVRLLFWSGQSFDESGLHKEGSFKAAEVRYTSAQQIKTKDLSRWLKKARTIQWDYKNIVKRRGVVERLK